MNWWAKYCDEVRQLFVSARALADRGHPGKAAFAVTAWALLTLLWLAAVVWVLGSWIAELGL